MKYQPIMATHGYVLSKDRKKVLLLHRDKKENDDHLGKWIGLGGKMIPEENIVTCMKREIREEAGIECLNMKLRGTINWTGFGAKGEDWFGFIFLIDEFSGVPFKSNPEGTVDWIDIKEMYSLPLWEGDRYFLPLVFDEDPRIFYGYMPYYEGNPLSWSFERI
jgi:8-oxo-dGTP diphosphatase